VQLELVEQRQVISQLVQVRFVKFKSDAIAFLDQPVLEGVGLAEAANPIFVVMTVLAAGVFPSKHLSNVRGEFSI